MKQEQLTKAILLRSEIDKIESEKSRISKLNQKNKNEGLSCEEIDELIIIANSNTNYALKVFQKEFDEL